MRKITFIGILSLIIAILLLVFLLGQEKKMIPNDKDIFQITIKEENVRIASWLAKKDDVLSSGKPYDLIMTGWVTPEEAVQLKSMNPDMLILAGLTVSFVYDEAEWMALLSSVANYGKANPIKITEDMYLTDNNKNRCAFGWKSEEFSTEEIYAMDPRNEKWKSLVVSFYEQVLNQPHHDGIIIDMVTDWSPCPEAITDEKWVQAIKIIMYEIKMANKENKLVIFNSGRDLSQIKVYEGYFDGYLLENALGNWGITFNEGLEEGDNKYLVIYAVDTDDTGVLDLNKMRLGLTLSLLNDNTFFTYDFGPRDHGQAWWFPEYNADLGRPLGNYYKLENAYYRDFEKGIVVSSPDSDITVLFDEEHTDLTTGITALAFTIYKGDGRIFGR